MGCYLVPTVVLLFQFAASRGIPAWKKNKEQTWLTLLLLGGALFGVVDHAWNGELFLFGEHLVWDLALGVLITAVIFGIWSVMVIRDRAAQRHLVNQ